MKLTMSNKGKKRNYSLSSRLFRKLYYLCKKSYLIVRITQTAENRTVAKSLSLFLDASLNAYSSNG